jgi:hypothetical protein
MVGDHAMYQLYLVVRGDLMLFLAAVNTPLSVVIRFMEKLCVDFTSCWICRYARAARSERCAAH